MTWVVVIVVGALIVAVALWAVPRTARRNEPLRTDPMPPAPGSTAGGGVPSLPPAEPPPEDPGRS